MNTLNICGLEGDVNDMSVKTRQPFYGSAYLAPAKKYGLELVIGDTKLQKAASSYRIRTFPSGR